MTRNTPCRSVHLMLVAAASLVGCQADLDGASSLTEAGYATTTFNGFFITNGVTGQNGLAEIAGFDIQRGLATTAGLSETDGLMTSEDGRATVRYLVRCALSSRQSLVKRDAFGTTYTFPGAIGLAPEWETSGCGGACQEWVSACMLAHVNTTGQPVALWLVGQHPAIGWGQSAEYPNQEGTFFGNIFRVSSVAVDTSGRHVVEAYYCNGPGFANDVVPGRLGDNDRSGEPYVNAYGQRNYKCSDSHGCTPADSPHSADGYKACDRLSPSGLTAWTTAWNAPLTVWRKGAAVR